MKQHPDRQPCRAITVQRGDDDDCRTDQNFESGWIYGVTPSTRLLRRLVASFNQTLSL
jgi:hypothetical protein